MATSIGDKLRNIKLLIEYDGTNYSGWQRQKNAVSIQGTIEKAIFKITGEKVDLIGASRTDAGVHAKEYVANFNTETKIPDDRIKNALNSKLPRDIVIIDSCEVDLDFHARYNSVGKRYSYTILNRNQPPALNRYYLYHYRRPLNVELMRIGAKYFVGKHDFAAFRNTGSSQKTSVRTILKLDVEQKGDIIIFYISADGFLYNMARIIVGTLVNVGIGKIKPEDIINIMESKDRINAGKAAPAGGLCLEKVFYT